jgi:uncharacterized membrane protein SirB2
MDLIDAYGPIKHAHVSLVAISVGLFAARGVGVLAGALWPMHALPRVGSVAIDTLLLTTGALLWAMLGLHPLQQTWLGVKLALLLVYIVLGSVALKRARTPVGRIAAFAAALATVAFMAGIALAHDPRGWFATG